MTENITTLRDNLISALKGKGLNQTQLAAHLGISVGLFSHVVTGKRKMTADFLARVLVQFSDLLPLCLQIFQAMYKDNGNDD